MLRNFHLHLILLLNEIIAHFLALRGVLRVHFIHLMHACITEARVSKLGEPLVHSSRFGNLRSINQGICSCQLEALRHLNLLSQIFGKILTRSNTFLLQICLLVDQVAELVDQTFVLSYC